MSHAVQTLVRRTTQHRVALLTLGALALTSSLASVCAARALSPGLRFGVSDSPNQFLVGGHLDGGDIAGRLRFYPSGTLGFGDNLTTLQLNADGRWVFPGESSNWRLYAGGGFGYVNYSPKAGDSSSGAGANFLIGATIPQRGHSFLLEARAGTGDLPDLEFLAGFSFD